MKAIIQTGGKQYKVAAGDVIYIEKLGLEDGAEVQFDTLMLFDGKKTTIGTPLLKEKVTGKVLGQVKGQKIIVFKYKAKKNIRKKQGHRQPYTRVEILAIEKAAAKKSTASKANAAEKVVEEAPAVESNESVAVES